MIWVGNSIWIWIIYTFNIYLKKKKKRNLYEKCEKSIGANLINLTQTAAKPIMKG